MTLTGITTAPKLGRIVRLGANSLQYQAYPGSVGTDEFSYTVTDQLGAVGQRHRPGRDRAARHAAAAARRARHGDRRGRPDRRVEALANDLIAAGDRVSIELVDPPEGVELASPHGPAC